jgi:ribonuclease HI
VSPQPEIRFPAHKPPPNCVTATIDGAARGNPGPAAYGVVFADAGGKPLTQLAGRLGRATNNVAEYRALLVALTYARTEGWRALRVRTDSELLARQLEGHYKVKSADLKPLYDEAQRLIASFIYFAVEAVPRKLTRQADKLANRALDKRPLGLRPRGKSATLAIRAVYEGGVLKPLDPLNLAEGEETLLIVRPRKATRQAD